MARLRQTVISLQTVAARDVQVLIQPATPLYFWSNRYVSVQISVAFRNRGTNEAGRWTEAGQDDPPPANSRLAADCRGPRRAGVNSFGPTVTVPYKSASKPLQSSTNFRYGEESWYK